MASVFAEHFAPAPDPFNMAHSVLGTGADGAIALEILGAEDGVWTYGALRAAVAGTARGLVEAGLRPGDRLLLRQGNSVACPITYLAAIWAGILPVPTAAGLTSREVLGLIEAVAPAAIAASEGVVVPQTSLPVLASRDLEDMRGLAPRAPDMGAPERPAYIVFTSGSSGRARPVCHAHRAVWARRMMWEGWYGLRASDRLLHAGAFNWTYTMGTGLMDPWAIGATALIPQENTASAELPGLLAASRATIFAAAPGVYRQMLRAQMPALPALRHGLSAGEALPATTRAAWEAATGTAVHEALGMSECSTYLSGSPARPAPPGTAGFPQPGRHLSVRADGAAVPFDTPGVLAIHRDDPGLMLGYWADGAPVRVEHDWFETGDQVSMAEDGAVTYLGRADDMMNAGGFRVSPLEVEAVLGHVAGVREVAACEVKVSEEASVIALFHVGGTEADLRAAAEAQLARYKQPRMYHARESLPRNANGKINRRTLRESTDICAPAHR